MNNNTLLKKIAPILSLMFFDVASVRVVFPILTLLFFESSSHLFPPSTPHHIRSYWYGIAIAAPNIISAFSGPFLSSMSDIWGRKQVFILAIVGAGIASTLCGFAIIFGSMPWFIIGCFLQGFFAKTNPIAQAAVAETVDSHKKVLAMGYLQTAISLGAAASPIIGGKLSLVFFNKINFAFPFFTSLFFCIIALAITLKYFTNPTVSNSQKASTWLFFKSSLKLFTNLQVLLISFLLLFTQISWGMYYQFIAPTLKLNFQFNATMLGLFIGMIAVWLALASSLGVWALQRFFSLIQMVVVSLLGILLGYGLTLIACFYHLNFFVWLGAAPVAMGDVIAFSVITTLYSNAVTKQQQGSIMGVGFLVYAFAWTLTGIGGGYLLSLSATAPLIFAPIGAGLALLLLGFSKQKLMKTL